MRQAIKNKEPTNEILIAKERIQVESISVKIPLCCKKTEIQKFEDLISEERCITMKTPFGTSVSKKAKKHQM